MKMSTKKQSTEFLKRPFSRFVFLVYFLLLNSTNSIPQIDDFQYKPTLKPLSAKDTQSPEFTPVSTGTSYLIALDNLELLLKPHSQEKPIAQLPLNSVIKLLEIDKKSESDIWLKIKMFAGKHFSCSAKACLNFVNNKQ